MVMGSGGCSVVVMGLGGLLYCSGGCSVVAYSVLVIDAL